MLDPGDAASPKSSNSTLKLGTPVTIIWPKRIDVCTRSPLQPFTAEPRLLTPAGRLYLCQRCGLPLTSCVRSSASSSASSASLHSSTSTDEILKQSNSSPIYSFLVASGIFMALWILSWTNWFRLVLTFLVLPFWYLMTRVDPDIFQTSRKTVVCV